MGANQGKGPILTAAARESHAGEGTDRQEPGGDADRGPETLDEGRSRDGAAAANTSTATAMPIAVSATSRLVIVLLVISACFVDPCAGTAEGERSIGAGHAETLDGNAGPW